MKRPPGQVTDFAIQARAFVEWCDTSHDGKSMEVKRVEILRQLSRLYVSGLRLPEIDDFDEAPDCPLERDADRERVTKNLQPLPLQYYFEDLAPSKLYGERRRGCGDLYDDLLDTYGDIAEGLWLYDNEHVGAAAFHWSENVLSLGRARRKRHVRAAAPQMGMGRGAVIEAGDRTQERIARDSLFRALRVFVVSSPESARLPVPANQELT